VKIIPTGSTLSCQALGLASRATQVSPIGFFDAQQEQQLAELAPRFTQDTRLLRIFTPLGPDKLLVESVHGEESVSRGYSFQLSLLSTDADIPRKSLLGQQALLELLTHTTCFILLLA
jgi:hypothetical protein